MTYQGYMALANDEGETIELVNASRVKAYTDNLAPTLGLRGCDDCEGLDAALGDTYTDPVTDFAPWYDPTDPATADFYGVYPLAFEGIDDSTRTIESAELSGDGSVVVGSRFTGKDIRVSGTAFAKDEAALYAGVSWLDSALNGTEEGRCFGDRLNLYSSCPPVQVLPPDFAEPYTLELGTPSRTSLVLNPRATDTARWTGNFGTTGAGTEVPSVGAGLVLPNGDAVSEYMRYTWTTASTGGSPYVETVYPTTTHGDITPVGTQVAVIMYLRSSTARTVTPRLVMTDGSGFASNAGASVAIPANTWTVISTVLTTTASTRSPKLRITQANTNTFAIGATWDVTAAMIVLNSSSLTYFDGFTTDTGSFVYGWTDEANESESVEIPPATIAAEAAQWTTTSGTVIGNADGVNFAWTSGDPEKVACREITGLIPGEQYQLRLRLEAFGDYFVSLGPACVERYQNLAPDPRLTATTMDLNGATVIDTHPASGSPDGGSFFRRQILTAGGSVFMGLSGTGTSAIPVNEGWSYVTSWYSRVSVTGGPSTRIDWRWYDSAGTVISTISSTSVAPTTAWVRHDRTQVAPVGAAYLQPRLVWTGTPLVGQLLDFAQAMVQVGTTPTDYVDGNYPDARWLGTPNNSVTAFEENVDYETIFGWTTDHNPPTEPTVLDFIARTDSIFLSIQPTDTEPATPTLNLQVQEALVRRVSRPGVVAFGTGDDAVAPTDGWTHLAPATMRVTWTLGQRSVLSLGQAPTGSALTYTTAHGMERTLYGLTPGSRYRLMVEFDTFWAPTDVAPADALEPVISVTNSTGLVTTYSDDNIGTFQYFRVVEFTATATSGTLGFHPTSSLSLGSNGSVLWSFSEYMVEEILDTDTTEPQPGRFEERTMYEVKASQGPILTNVRTAPCGVMGQISYSLRAGNPFKYRSPIFAGGLPAGTSVEVADIPCTDGLPQIINFAYNPSLETNAVSYAVSGVNATAARTASPTARVGGFVYRGTAPNSPGNRLDALTAYYDPSLVTSGPIPISGEELTVSIYFRATAAAWIGTYDWNVFVAMVGFPSFSFTGTEVVTDSGTWHRIEQTFTLPDNIDLSLIEFHVETPASITQGGGMDLDGFMVQRGDTASAPFDETFTDAEWSGDPNTSALLLNQTLTDISADPDCPAPPAPPGPPQIDETCIDEPNTYNRTVVAVSSDTVPRNLTAYPVITLTAGAADVRQARIRFWENPNNLTIDELDPCSYDGEIIVSYLAAGATMVIDGVLREATVSLTGFEDQNANHVLYGPDGGPVDWPELSGGIPYLVTLELDSGEPYTDTLMLVDLVVRD